MKDKKLQARVTIRYVTPKQAELLLSELHESQRSRRDFHCEKYAQEMLEGRWVLSPDAITLICGKVANGQHRLEAVKESETTQPFLFLETEDEGMFQTIDVGMRRTNAEVAGIRENGAAMGSIASWVVGYHSRRVTPTLKPRNPRPELVDWLQGPTYPNAVALYASWRPTQEVLTVLPLTMVVAFLIINKVTVDTPASHIASSFVRVLLTGDRPGGGTSLLSDNALNLRNRLLQNQRSRAKLSAGVRFYLLFKYFTASLNNKRVSRADIAMSEGFPYLVEE